MTTGTTQIINPACWYTPKELADRIGSEKGTVLGWLNEKPDPLPCRRRGNGKIILISAQKFLDWLDRNEDKVAAAVAAPSR